MPLIKSKKGEAIVRFIVSSPYYTIKIYLEKDFEKIYLNHNSEQDNDPVSYLSDDLLFKKDNEIDKEKGYIVEVKNIGGSDCNSIDRGCWVIIGNIETDKILHFETFDSGAFSSKEKKIFRVEKGSIDEDPCHIEGWVLDKGLLGIDEMCHISF